MTQCIGICQIDEFGYCIGCGRSQQEIDAVEAPTDEAAVGTDGEVPAASPDQAGSTPATGR